MLWYVITRALGTIFFEENNWGELTIVRLLLRLDWLTAFLSTSFSSHSAATSMATNIDCFPVHVHGRVNASISHLQLHYSKYSRATLKILDALSVSSLERAVSAKIHQEPLLPRDQFRSWYCRTRRRTTTSLPTKGDRGSWNRQRQFCDMLRRQLYRSETAIVEANISLFFVFFYLLSYACNAVEINMKRPFILY